jgi:hypothetical protein
MTSTPAEIYEGFEIRLDVMASRPLRATIRRLGSRLYEHGKIEADSVEDLRLKAQARVDAILADTVGFRKDRA